MTVLSDENMLHAILRNLIANAGAYTPENGNIKISFEKENTAIHIFNAGKPIDPSVAAKIFDWSHIGYGLKLSKALVDKLGIELKIEPQADGNLFVVKMD